MKQLLSILLVLAAVVTAEAGETRYFTFTTNGVSYSYCTNLDKTVSIEYRPSGNDYSAAVDCGIAGKLVIPAAFGSRAVSSISRKAFMGCSNLTEVVFSPGIRNIGAYAFWNCTNLAAVTIPSTVTNIGEYAFFECPGMRNLVIPEGVVSLGQLVCGDACITNLVLPVSATNMNYAAFYGVTSLRSVTVPYSVMGLNRPFQGSMTGIVSIVCLDPENWTSIRDNLFEDFSALRGFTVPDAVTNIGYYAFHSCTALTNIVFGVGSRLVSITDHAFENCSSLASISLPESVTNIGYAAFLSCTSLVEVALAQPGKYTFYGLGLSAVTNATLLGDRWVDLCDPSYGYFYYCTKLAHVTIPATVTNVINAFSHCDSLRDVEYLGDPPLATNTSGRGLYQGCPADLVSHVPSANPRWTAAFGTNGTWCGRRLSDNVYETLYTNNAITILRPYGTNGVGDLVVPGTFFGKPAYTVGERFIQNEDKVTSLTFSEGITNVGAQLAYESHAITNITFPSTMTYLGDELCCWATNIHEVVYRGNAPVRPPTAALTSYDFAGGYYGYGNTLITIPQNSTGWNIDTNGYWCEHKIYFDGAATNDIPYGISRVWTDAYRLSVSNGETTLQGPRKPVTGAFAPPADFFGHPVTRIATNAFAGAAITSLVVPENVASIGDSAFAHCGALAAVTLPASLTNLDSLAFGSCAALTNVTFLGNAPAANLFIYKDSNKNLTSHVRRGTTGWDGNPASKALPASGLWCLYPIVFFGSASVTVDGVEVPYDWLAGYKLPAGTTDADYEAAATNVWANGWPAWKSYVADLDPTNADSRLLVQISMTNGTPYVSYAPVSTNRVYTMQGRQSLTAGDDWAATNAASRFFRVKVEMK